MARGATRRKVCYHGLWVVLATFVLNFCSLGIVYSAGILIVPLQKSFPNAGPGLVSFLPSIILSFGLLSSLLAGRLQDVFQRYTGSIQPLFILGSCCFWGGAFTMTAAAHNSLAMVWLGAIIAGIGVGWTGLTAAGICVQWFDHRNRSTMLLLAMAGSGLGNYCYTRAMQQLLEYFAVSSGGSSSSSTDAWRPAVQWIGLFSTALSIVASMLMRLPLEGEVEQYNTANDKEDPHETDSLLENFHTQYGNSRGNRIDTFQHLHQQVGTNIMKDGSMPETMRKRPRSRTTEASSEAMALSLEMRGQWMMEAARQPWSCPLAEFEALATLHANYREAMKRQEEIPCSKCTHAHVPYLSLPQILWTRTILALYAWTFLSSFAFTSIFVHLPSFAQSVGLSATDGSTALSYTGVGLLLGNITLGWVTDMIGPIRSLQSTMMILMLLMFAWPFCNTLSRLSMLAFLYGYCATTQSSVPLLIITDAFGESSPDGILTLLGILNVCKVSGYLLGPTIVGILYNSFGNSYQVGSLFLGGTMLVANIWLFLLPSPQSQMERIAQMYGSTTNKCVKTCLGAHQKSASGVS